MTTPLALVVGGTRGIGRACAEALDRAGWTVLTASRNKVPPFPHWACNIRSPDDRERALKWAADQGRLDALLLPVGGIGDKAYYDLNFASPVAFAREARDLLTASKGSVVFFSSTDALRNPSVSYGAAKAALEATTLALAREWAPLRIRVNCIRPGNVVGTEAWPVEVPGVAAAMPLGRFVTVDEVAAAALMLCENRSITGAVIPVDGGVSL